MLWTSSARMPLWRSRACEAEEGWRKGRVQMEVEWPKGVGADNKMRVRRGGRGGGLGKGTGSRGSENARPLVGEVWGRQVRGIDLDDGVETGWRGRAQDVSPADNGCIVLGKVCLRQVALEVRARSHAMLCWRGRQ